MFVSNDYGKTWNSIRGNLPIEAGVTRVIREDIVNENVLYLGCEFSAWVSIDRGESWTKFGGDLPTVAVHDFAQHPLTGDVVVATHGRGAWIADVTALRQWSVDAIKAQATLYRPNRVVMWRNGPTRGDNGPRQFVGQNPSRSAHVYFSLGENASQAKVTISDIKGRELVEFRDLPATKGLHHVEWNLRPANQGRGRGGGSLAAGDYLVTLNVDGDEQKQTLTIDSDPSYTVNDQNSMTQEEFEAIVGEGD